MSSAGRRPTGPASPLPWRSMSMSKKRAPASVSLVFAEPEQGAPLESAATKLPSSSVYEHGIRRRDSASTLRSTYIMHDDRKDTESVMEQEEPVEEQASPATATLAQNPTKSAPDILVSAQWEGITDDSARSESPTTTTTDSVLDVPVATLGIPFASTPSLKSTPKASPSGTSWFGSLTRSQPKIVSLGTPPTPAPDATPAAPPATIAPEPESEPQPSPPQPIPSGSSHGQRHPSRSWFSSPISTSPLKSSTVPDLQPHPVTTFPGPASPAKSYTSVDEEVPRLTVSTPFNSPHPPSVMQSAAAAKINGNGSETKLSSLNPSTSRFTLGIPLLGRPKVPLDQVVAGMVAEEGNKGVAPEPTAEVKAEQVTQMETIQTATTTTATTTTTVDPPPTAEPSLSTEAPPAPLTADEQKETQHTSEVSSSSSWWGYVGWSNTAPAPASTPEPISIPENPSPPSPSAGDSPTNTIRASKSTPHLPSAQSPPPPPSAPLPTSPTSVVEPEPEPEAEAAPKAKAQSVFSAGTSGSAVWYVPWNWYNTPEPTPAAKDGEGEGKKTESELVKEEALARDLPDIKVSSPSPPTTPNPTPNPTPTSTTISIPTPAPPPEAVISTPNPIESGISANKSGWAAFFSSTSLLVKNLKDVEKRDENGMEVMDIDEDEDDVGAQVGGGGKGDGKAGVMVVAKRSQSPLPAKVPKGKLDISTKEPISNAPKDSGMDKGTKPPAAPLANSASVKREAAKASTAAPAVREPTTPTPKATRKASPDPSPKPKPKPPASPTPKPKPPNLVLPTWDNTFHTAPRSLVPAVPASAISKTLNYVSGVLFTDKRNGHGKDKGKGKARASAKNKEFEGFGRELPKAFDVLGKELEPDVLQGCTRAVVIGIHGWFPGAVIKTVLGEPTGTSGKFVDMMLQALDDFQDKHDVRFKKITKIPLEGEGTINKRVDRLYQNLLANKEWMNDLHVADVIFLATHSQGSVVSTHLIDRLIRDGHIRTFRSIEVAGTASAQALASGSAEIVPTKLKPQRLCCLALCGIHLGPLRYLSTSSLLQPYFQYFESAAARELFEFQDTESAVSKQYVKALTNVMHHGTKMVYVASLNDQVVPMYSGLFTTASHPLILRAMYIDGDAYQSSDFLSNLLVLLLRVMNSGISDSGLLAHLSEATAGSLNGVGHSTVYEELATYSLAVDYCFLTNEGMEAHPELVVEPFDAKSEQNDYEIPWALRDVIADERVAHFFSSEFVTLRDAFRDWHPKTAILREIKKKLQPIQRLPSSIVKAGSSHPPADSVSKL